MRNWRKSYFPPVSPVETEQVKQDGAIIIITWKYQLKWLRSGFAKRPREGRENRADILQTFYRLRIFLKVHSNLSSLSRSGIRISRQTRVLMRQSELFTVSTMHLTPTGGDQFCSPFSKPPSIGIRRVYNQFYYTSKRYIIYCSKTLELASSFAAFS